MVNGTRAMTIAERIAFFSEPSSAGCLEWTARLTESGYGELRVNGKTWKAHRLAYVDAHGPISDDLEVDHICHNRKCVNVDHLRAVPKWVNQHNRAGANANSRTGYRGVHPYQRGFRGEVQVRSKKYHTALHATPEEARDALEALRISVMDAITKMRGEDQ
jgi:hypothetical protein